jgi:hypothetical protein
MPIPSPRKDESKKAFVSRCVSTIYDEYKDHEGQAVAICMSTWRDHKAKAAYIVRAGDDEYAIVKEPIDSDIKKREKQAGDPPLPNPDKGGPASSPNPDSMDNGKKPPLDEMPWMMGEIEVVTDPQTGLAKWPLSFRKVEKDTKRPNKGGDAAPAPKVNDQPPMAC